MRIKNFRRLRLVIYLLICFSFVSREISYCSYFSDSYKNDFLAPENISQREAMVSNNQLSVDSTRKEMTLLSSIISIADFVLGADEKARERLSVPRIKDILTEELDGIARNISISGLKVVDDIALIPIIQETGLVRYVLVGYKNSEVMMRVNGEDVGISERYSIKLVNDDYARIYREYLYGNASAVTTINIDRDTPDGVLTDILEKRHNDIENDRRADGRTLFSEEYIRVGGKIDRETIVLNEMLDLGIKDGLELDLSLAPWRATYKQSAPKKASPYSVNEPHRATKPDKPCIFCALPNEEILFKVNISGTKYIVAANINPFGERHVLLITEDAIPQDAEKRIKDVAVFLKSLGSEYEAIFNAPGASASMLHFHAQITKSRAPLRRNIDKGLILEEKIFLHNGVRQSMLKGWFSEVKRIIGSDPVELSKQADFFIEGLKREGIPYNLLIGSKKDGRVEAFIIPGGNEAPKELASIDRTGTMVIGGREVAGDIILPNTIVGDRIKQAIEIWGKALINASTKGILGLIEEENPESKIIDTSASRNIDMNQIINKSTFEARSFINELIVMARTAKRQNQGIILGIETDWIPGNSKGSLQHEALNPLIKGIKATQDFLLSIGIDNVTIIHESAEVLGRTIMNKKSDTSSNFSNIIVLASKYTLALDSFSALREAPNNDKPFLAGVDDRLLKEFYQNKGEIMTEQLYIQIISMLSITLEMAMGKKYISLSIVESYDAKKRMITFLPNPEPFDYETLREIYNKSKMALLSA